MEEQSFFPTRKSVGTMQLIDPAAVAAAEAAKAQIQAAYIIALQKPRNQMQARSNILMACKRTEFAEKAEYSKPVGKHKITGPSVRFAELAIREWENVRIETVVLYEDDNVKRLRVSAIDLETNAQFSRDIQIKKTIERRSKKGREEDVISERKNTYGDIVYILRATDDEMLTKESAWVSKIIRNEGLRLIPTDIIEEGLKQARKTLQSKAAMDPDGEKKKIVDAFSGIGIKPVQIGKYLGHDLGTIAPAEIAELRSIYRTIRDGESSWNDYIKTADQTEHNAQDQTPPNNVTDLMKDRKGPSLYGGKNDNQQSSPSTVSKNVEKQEIKTQDQSTDEKSPLLGEGMDELQLWELLKKNVGNVGVESQESFAKVEAYIHHNVEETKQPIVDILRVAVNKKPTELMLSVTDWYTRKHQNSGRQKEPTGAARYSGANSHPPEGVNLDGSKEDDQNKPDQINRQTDWDPRTSELMGKYYPEKRDAVMRAAEEMGIPYEGRTPKDVHKDILAASAEPPEDKSGSQFQEEEKQVVDIELIREKARKLRGINTDRWDAITRTMSREKIISTTFIEGMNAEELEQVINEFKAIDDEQEKF